MLIIEDKALVIIHSQGREQIHTCAPQHHPVALSFAKSDHDQEPVLAVKFQDHAF